MWKAQVRNLERNKIQHVNSTAKLLKKKPALVDNISVEGWVEPGVGGEHCQRYICSLSGKKQSGDRGKKKKKNIISFGWKKDHCKIATLIFQWDKKSIAGRCQCTVSTHYFLDSSWCIRVCVGTWGYQWCRHHQCEQLGLLGPWERQYKMKKY